MEFFSILLLKLFREEYLFLSIGGAVFGYTLYAMAQRPIRPVEDSILLFASGFVILLCLWSLRQGRKAP